eukprot:Cvel_29958.t1-p1 / transcript=Cvel_29958.t1 / gene=Cvel_29958 / organism=Chromera_velia_CCMP2878 / gene_product=hypothetical protein / transcript_product=hypothetical protein / location=Cvel_scaffold4196:4022-7302(+) / protein_length=441 / sequence_SO=supercontig / SO=protein_coding / is_pseudo=false
MKETQALLSRLVRFRAAVLNTTGREGQKGGWMDHSEVTIQAVDALARLGSPLFNSKYIMKAKRRGILLDKVFEGLNELDTLAQPLFLSWVAAHLYLAALSSTAAEIMGRTSLRICTPGHCSAGRSMTMLTSRSQLEPKLNRSQSMGRLSQESQQQTAEEHWDQDHLGLSARSGERIPRYKTRSFLSDKGKQVSFFLDDCEGADEDSPSPSQLSERDYAPRSLSRIGSRGQAAFGRLGDTDTESDSERERERDRETGSFISSAQMPTGRFSRNPRPLSVDSRRDEEGHSASRGWEVAMRDRQYEDAEKSFWHGEEEGEEEMEDEDWNTSSLPVLQTARQREKHTLEESRNGSMPTGRPPSPLPSDEERQELGTESEWPRESDDERGDDDSRIDESLRQFETLSEYLAEPFPRIEVLLSGVECDSLGYADDLVLIAESVHDLQ